MNQQSQETEGVASFQLYQKPSELTPQRCQRIVKYARKRLRGQDNNSEHAHDNSDANTSVQEISHSQITLGRQLGKGAFSSVYSIKSVSKKTDDADEVKSEKMVVKFLRTKLYDNHGLFAASAADLVKEGNILSTLCHTNVIRLHAVSSLDGVGAYSNGYHDAYFLVLERLKCTLTDRVQNWQSRHKELFQAAELGGHYDPAAQFMNVSNHSSSWKSKLSSSFRSKKSSDDLLEDSARTTASNETNYTSTSSSSAESCFEFNNNATLSKTRLLEERLDVIQQLADAIAYLHDNNVIHRDLKPDNIGFDADGVLKVFDFDIARVVPTNMYHEEAPEESSVFQSSSASKLNKDETFLMTQRVGSPRYMSPECARREPYNLKADVYSYALLTHQILTLEKPYDDILDEDHDELVFYKGVRPHVPIGLPPKTKELLRSAWSHSIMERPTMETVRQIISEEYSEILRLGTIERSSSFIPVANTTGYIWSCSFKSISDNNKMLKKIKKKKSSKVKATKGEKPKGLLSSIFRRSKNTNVDKMGMPIGKIEHLNVGAQ